MVDDCSTLLVCKEGVLEDSNWSCAGMSECDVRDGVEECYCMEGTTMSNPDYDMVAGDEVQCDGEEF